MTLIAATWLASTLATTSALAARPVRVEVEGVGGELRDNVLSVLGIRELERAREVSEAAVRRRHQEARGQIAYALEPFGYYRPEIHARLERQGETWVARYEIRPGPPLRLRAVELELSGEGADDPSLSRLADGFPLRPGDVLRHPVYELAKAALAEAALEQGYLDARFESREVRIDRDAYVAEIRLRFDTGPRFRFGPVRFEQDALDPEFLRGYVTFRPGDPLELSRLLVLQNALGQSPYFRSVEVRPLREEAEGDRVPIAVRLVPHKPLRLDVGAGYGTDTGPQGRLAVDLRRLNRSGHRADAELRASQIEKSITTRYEIPWAYPRTDRLALSAGYGDFDTETSDSEILRAGAKYSRARGRWREVISLLFQRERFAVASDRGTKTLLLPEASWSRVEADDRLDPRRGYRLRFTVRGAEDDVVSDVSFFQIVAGGKAIVSPGRRHRLIGRVDAGYTEVSRFRELPPSFRFFAGGAQSVRGYAFRSLGPRDQQGAVIGGSNLVVGSLEYEFRFLRRWGIAAFYDVGNALASLDQGYADGAGVGLRWVSPVGTIRADAAFPLDGDESFRFHLAIGPDL